MLGLSFTKTKRCSPTSGEPTPVSANRRETLRKLLMVDATRVHTVEIRQEDGTVARFLQSALKEAFAANVRRIRGGEDVPAEYPLTAAARSSSNPSWHGTFYAGVIAPEEPVEELFE
jgi:hypothetical protein